MTFGVTLRFESAETLLQALDHIGDADAPVYLADGSSVRVGDDTFRLWESFPAVRVAIITSTRLEYLRSQIEAERISWGEIAELQSLAKYIDPGDTLLLFWAGVPEHEARADLEERRRKAKLSPFHWLVERVTRQPLG